MCAQFSQILLALLGLENTAAHGVLVVAQEALIVEQLCDRPTVAALRDWQLQRGGHFMQKPISVLVLFLRVVPEQHDLIVGVVPFCPAGTPCRGDAAREANDDAAFERRNERLRAQRDTGGLMGVGYGGHWLIRAGAVNAVGHGAQLGCRFAMHGTREKVAVAGRVRAPLFACT